MSTTKLALRTLSADETEELGASIGRAARPGDVIALRGELGAGKTVVVRGIARGLGLPVGEVTSPTFIVVHEHPAGRVALRHVDLYRLDRDGARSTGWDERLDEIVTAIEWPERLGPDLPADRLEMRLEHRGLEERDVEIEALGPLASALLDALR